VNLGLYWPHVQNAIGYTVRGTPPREYDCVVRTRLGPLFDSVETSGGRFETRRTFRRPAATLSRSCGSMASRGSSAATIRSRLLSMHGHYTARSGSKRSKPRSASAHQWPN
jgi:hypothetical protein